MTSTMINPGREELLGFFKEKLIDNYIIAFVGSPLRSDDRAALILYELLDKDNGAERLIYCEYGLETCIEDIKHADPKGLIIVDAGYAENMSPGTIVVTTIENVRDAFTLATTHNIPIRLILKILEAETSVEQVYVVAIIASSLDIGIEISDPVKRSIGFLAEIINEALREISTSNKT